MSAQTERPIIFNGEMIRAILSGSKTQTRRVIKERWQLCRSPEDEPEWFIEQCPYGKVGDRLWVRETLVRHYQQGDVPDTITYAADRTPVAGNNAPLIYCGLACWRWSCKEILPSIFMPRWASRITLEVTGVRVERVQDISEVDAIAEGIERINNPFSFHWCWKDYTGNNQSLSPVFSYISLWDSINAKRGYSWDTNPWVWVIEFRKVDTHDKTR